MAEQADMPRGQVLAIGAHPDDIELGCGGTLSKLAAAGVPVRALVFSRGRRGAMSDEDRAAETRKAMAAIGVTEVEILDYEDTQLWRHITDLIPEIERRTADLADGRVYTMFQLDRHQDHRAVYEASVIACRHVAQVLGYETPSSYPNFVPTLFEELGDALDTKVRALQCHASQGDRLYMQEEKIRAAAHFRGAQIDRGPSEGFVPYKMVM